MFFIPIIDAHRGFEGERVRVNKGYPQEKLIKTR
jgi:hypothetical protein